jgi:hypothetical protein
MRKIQINWPHWLEGIVVWTIYALALIGLWTVLHWK